MSLTIVPLDSKHLEDAAALVSARFRALRRTIPQAPARYEDSAQFLPMLATAAQRSPGVAALDGGRLAGFFVAARVPSWKGQRTTYSAEWANGAAGTDSRRIYQVMYTAMSAQWVADGYFNHFVTMLAHDRAGIDGWHWLDFGHYVVDAVRDLSPAQTNASGPVAQGIEIRRATLDDAPAALAMWTALWRHLSAAPTFLVSEPYTADGTREWLTEPRNALWLAFRNGEPVACLGIGPANEDACTTIRDPGTASITSAYTRPDVRGSGVATAILDRALAWARDVGYVRCAVDFEAANVLAARFWLRHFQPVCISLSRHVNPAITGS